MPRRSCSRPAGGIVTDSAILRLANNTSGGTVAPTGLLNITGGSFSVATTTLVGATGVSAASSNAKGTITISAGSFSSTGAVTLANTSYTDGTVNLNGGTFTAPQINTNTGATHSSSTFNFNGGTLITSADNSTFLQGLTTANVRNGGALIDSNGYDVTIAQNLLHSALGGDAATDGGLNKAGSGTLTLTGLNTYTGDTVVQAGTLSLANADLNDTAAVNVYSGALLDLSFATTDVVGSLIYNGVNLGSGIFNASNTSFITGTGSLQVVAAVPAPEALPAGLILLGIVAAKRRRHLA
jgi:autotransporter-associated beta strand protein